MLARGTGGLRCSYLVGAEVLSERDAGRLAHLGRDAFAVVRDEEMRHLGEARAQLEDVRPVEVVGADAALDDERRGALREAVDGVARPRVAGVCQDAARGVQAEAE